MEHSDDRTTSTPSSAWTREHGRSLSRAAGQRDAGFSPRSHAHTHTDDLDLEDFSPDDQAELSRRIDLDDDPNEDEARFLRATKRVSVRKGTVTRKTATRIRIFAIAAGAVCFAGIAAFAVARYATQSWRFRLQSSDNIETTGLKNVSRAQVMEILGADIGRNLFKVPLEDRRVQLQEIPWVESAVIMRLLPDHLRIAIVERKPVAFVRIGSKVSLIDEGGVIMELPRWSARAKSAGHGQEAYSFPVITGMADAEPLSTRAARMKIFDRLVSELNAGGGNYSKDLSEVELSDPDDVKVTVEDPNGALIIHLGSSNFLVRYQIYLNHVQEWRQQFSKLESVDLRYNGQIIVNPGSEAPERVNGKHR
jgi:cell division protein FtsQ